MIALLNDSTQKGYTVNSLPLFKTLTKEDFEKLPKLEKQAITLKAELLAQGKEYRDLLLEQKVQTLIAEAVEHLIQVLASKTQQDVIESVEVFSNLDRMGISAARRGVRMMLSLVFSKDNKVAEAVVEGYSVLYLNEEVEGLQQAENLLMLVGGASQVEMTCIEELLNRLKEDPELIKSLFHNIS